MKRVYSNPATILLFLTPALLIYFFFCLFPIFQSFFISLYRWDILGTKTWVGLGNYTRMLHDELLIQSTGHIFTLLIIVVVITIPVAFMLAWLLSQKLFGTGFIRSVMYIPNLLSTVAVGTLWIYLYHNQYGIVNRILGLIGIHSTGSLLSNPKTVIYAIGFVMSWQSIGFYIILFMVAIQNIPQDITDSAKVDGLNQWQRIRYILLPLIVPTIEISLVLLITAAFKSFDYVYVLSGGGPNHASEVMSSYMYTVGFKHLDFGYASAIGLILFIICFVITQMISLFGNKQEAAQY
jgi:raffinose/stachyose/melibiose transport system permease protein